MKMYGHQKLIYRIISLVFIVSLNSIIYADNGIPDFNISVPITSLNIGEPLVVELEYHFKEPQISNKKEILNQIDPEAYLYIDKEDITIYQNRLQYLFKLLLQDESGLDYKGTFIIWYNVLEKKLFFDKSGEYIIRVGFSKEFLSNPLKITVKSENRNAKEALVDFKDLDDYLFLMVGINQYPDKRYELLERLKQVQKQSQGTMLEKWASARLGIEHFKDMIYGEEKDRSMIDEIHYYLNTGIELPDEFPVREETLYDLANVEDMKGNKEKAGSLREELVKKYPNGAFTKEYIDNKKILAKIGNNTTLVNQAISDPPNNNKLILIICGLSLIAAIGIAIFIGKRKEIK